MPGLNDDDKLDAAIAEQKASGSPGGESTKPIVFSNRMHTLNSLRKFYTGLRWQARRSTGQKNPELSGGVDVGALIKLGGSVGLNGSAWLTSPGADVHNVYIANMGFTLGQNRQWADYGGGGSIYPGQFHSLAFNYAHHVMGSPTRLFAVTQMTFSGMWTINNVWGPAFQIGGSDNSFWMDGFLNIGPSGSTSQYGYPSNNHGYLGTFSSLTNTDVGYIYMTALNGWRGLRIMGSASELSLFGGVYEGYKSTRQNGLYSGPAPGSLLRVENGAVRIYGTRFGQGLDNPDSGEEGLIQMLGGELDIQGAVGFGANMNTANLIQHTGGRLSCAGIQKRQNGGITGRPRVKSSFTAGSGANAFYCPDHSVAVV